MEFNQNYDFCPRCGALMYKGQCKSCEDYMQNMQYYNPQQNFQYTYQNMPPKKKHTGLIIGLIIGGVLFLALIAGLLAVVMLRTYKNYKVTEKTIEELEDDYYYNFYDYEDYDFSSDFLDEYGDSIWDDYDLDEYYDDLYGNEEYDDEDSADDFAEESTEDFVGNERIDLDGDGIGDLSYKYGAKGLNAEYYEEIVDYIRYDLSYSVNFFEYTDDEGKVECYYPYLEGEQTFLSEFNDFFYTIAAETEDITDANDCTGSSVAYVTYMDEELLSVVFIETYIFSNGITYEDILCYNFDMKSGKMIETKINDISDEFLNEMRKRCLEQGTEDADYLFEKYTNEELKGILSNQSYAFVNFYTPLGMELGITYGGFWCCSTFKDYEKYVTNFKNNIDI